MMPGRLSVICNLNSTFLIVFYLRKDPISEKYFTVLGIAIILKKNFTQKMVSG